VEIGETEIVARKRKKSNCDNRNTRELFFLRPSASRRCHRIFLIYFQSMFRSYFQWLRPPN